jgi:hypothetical protein
MEFYKRKITLDRYKSWDKPDENILSYGSDGQLTADTSSVKYVYGKITATTFNIDIFLIQSIDDLGMFTDVEFTPVKK